MLKECGLCEMVGRPCFIGPLPPAQMAEMVTFMLTAVYAMSAFLRIREVYLNKGKTLTEKVRTCRPVMHSVWLTFNQS